MTVGNLARMAQLTSVPRALAVVLNWCAAEDTIACVLSLEADRSAKFDILIVDNASPDGSGPLLEVRFPQHAFLQTGQNVGYAGGNLRATDWALERGYDYILIINDDAEVTNGCVGKLIETLESNPDAAAAAPTILHHGTDIIWFAGGEFAAFKAMGTHSDFGSRMNSGASANPPHEVGFLSGCVLLLRASVVRELGGFRAEFFAYVEDLELSLRYRKSGWSLIHVPAAIASHKVPIPTPSDGPFAIRLRDKNRRRLAALHYGWPMRLLFATWFYPTRLIHWARFKAAADHERASAIVRGATERL